MLRTLDAAVILVAHDRWFLEAVTTAVLELENGKSVYFPGAWHVWRQEQAGRDLHQAKTATRQAEDIARLERFVERFRYKKSLASQAQSKLKQIQRIKKEQVFAPDHRKRVLGFEFIKPARSGRDVVVADGLVVQAGDKPLLDNAAFYVQRGEHVALVGPNGSGQDDAARDDARSARSEGGHGAPRPRRRDGVLLAARGGARRARLGSRGGDGRHRPEAARRAEAPRAVPLLRLGRARESGRRPVGR